ncbi:16S rRNA (cytosine(1402)-N(4))-methyltransferase RsmH [candidate division KSB1 bacterium]|nr:16S rRNA (cytosine(1402)-N(4))-methyltransferase RsmH [candidate division KSB1 bacterium]
MAASGTFHIPVLAEVVCEYLITAPNGIYVDGTLGGGGHAHALLSRLGPGGRVIGLDWDDAAIGCAESRLAEYRDRIQIIPENYRFAGKQLTNRQITEIDGFLLDLGVSSYQIDTVGRGFSFQNPAPLDMRMSATQELTAAEILHQYSERALADIFYRFGEERFARRIARRIVEQRKSGKIADSQSLGEIIRAVVPPPLQIKSLARIFQALRIEVNRELANLEAGLKGILPFIKPGGRLVVIAYHSLEDRLVKQFFRAESQVCQCPPQFPHCVCGAKGQLKMITRKAVQPTEAEMQRNPRARSARLRVAEKVQPER